MTKLRKEEGAGETRVYQHRGPASTSSVTKKETKQIDSNLHRFSCFIQKTLKKSLRQIEVGDTHEFFLCHSHGNLPTTRHHANSNHYLHQEVRKTRKTNTVLLSDCDSQGGKLDTHSRRPNERSIHILTVLWGAWELCGNYMLNWNNFVDIQCSYPAPPFVNQIVSSSANNNLYLLAKNCQKIHYMSNATCYDKDKDNAERERELTREDQVIYREQKVTTTKGNNPNYAH